MKKPRFLTLREALVLAGVGVVLLVWLLLPRSGGGYVVVTRGGEPVGRYALHTPIRTDIQGAHGLALTLVIEHGQARVENARCPDLLCQHHSPVSRAGESIVCLPAQVSLIVEGGEDLGPDAVSG